MPVCRRQARNTRALQRLTGCEIAYDLYLQGKQPTIVEMKDDLIAVTGVCLANASYLRDFFKTNQVPVCLETSLKEILIAGVYLLLSCLPTSHTTVRAVRHTAVPNTDAVSRNIP